MAYYKSFYNVEIPTSEGLLLYNILSQSFVFLDKEYLDYYRNPDRWKTDTEKIREFRDKNFIVDFDDRQEFIKKHVDILKNGARSLSISIVPTTACNFRCDYCFEKNKRLYNMDEYICEKTVKFIENKIESKEYDSVHLTYIGGEPLIKQDIVINTRSRIKSICDKNNIKFSTGLITNGFYFNKNTAKTLVDKIALGFCQITFDGNRYYHNMKRFTKGNKGSYDAIFCNLREILDSNIDNLFISVRVQITRENIDSISEFIYDFNKLPYSDKVSIYFSPVYENECDTFDNDLFDLFLEKIIPLTMKSNFKINIYPNAVLGGCSVASKDGYLIDANGDIKKCWELIGKDKYIIGNVVNGKINEKIEELWSKINLNERCFKCKYLPICNGGCPYKRIENKSFCVHWKENLNKLLVRMYELNE